MQPSPLSEYIRTASRAALDHLIRNQIDFVYAAAVRQLRDPHLAQDVTQAVFLVLAKRAKSIRSEAALPGWLFKTTRYAAANVIKMEQRRRKHEQAAALQRPEPAMPQTQLEADELIPLLDQAIARLNQSDRQIILLRYLQSREFSDVAAILGISEIAARKRLTRATDRLRQIFASHGQAIESTTLATTLTAAATQAAPTTVTASVLSATASPSAATLAQGIHWMLILSQAKAIAAVIVLVILTAATTKTLISHTEQRQAVAPQQPSLPAAPAAQLDAKGTFTVTCIDPANKPVAGAQVYLAQARIDPGKQDESNSVLGPVTTDAAGIARFETQFDHNVQSYAVYARVPDKLISFTSQFSLADPAQPIPSSITIPMVPSYAFHGSVTVPAGFKAQSTKVITSTITLRSGGGDIGAMLFREAPPAENLLSQIYDASVNPDGSFTITDVPNTGTLYLTANAPGLAETQITTPTPANGPPPVLAMQREATVGGMVTAPDGTPIPNVKVDALLLGNEMLVQHEFSATTDAHGIYAIHRLPNIYVGLRATTEILTMPILPLRLVTSTAVVKDLHLQTGTLVTGLATDTQGKPLPKVLINASAPADSGATLTQASTDSAGHYTLRVPAGTAKISIDGPPDGFDYPSRRDSQKNITISPGTANFTGPTWRLPRAKPEPTYATATITGRVVDEHGNGIPNLPIEDATVEGSNNPIQVYPTAATTDSTGHYSATVTANLPHKFSPDSDDFDSPKTRGVTPQPNQAITFPDLIVHSRPVIGTISCIVTDTQGHPLDNFNFSTSDTHGWHHPDNGARFTIPVRRQQTTLLLSKAGYKYRNWSDLPPNAQDVHLVLDPESDKGPDYKSRTKIPTIPSLLNHPAPPLNVDWIINPNNKPPTTAGRLTVLAFDWDSGWDSTKEKPDQFAADLAKICSAADAVPIIIYSPQSTAPGLRAVLPNPPPNIAIGIDQFFTAGFANDPTGTSFIAYGAQKLRTVYIISPDGTLIYTQQGLNGLDSHLLN